MAALEFFIPTNRVGKGGRKRPLDGTSELVNAERGGWGSGLKKRNGKHAERFCSKAMEDSGWECPTRRCLVTLTFVEPHDRRDPDNIYGGAKFILDGIIKPRGRRRYGAGALEDDSQRWIELRFGPIEVDKENVGCRVRIEEIDD